MESKEEVHSDDGSFELIDFDDYAVNMEDMNTKADFFRNRDISSDGSYEFLSSELSDILVLTEGEASAYEDLSAQIKFFSLESENEAKSDPSEEEEEEFSGMEFPDGVDMSRKRNFMTMAYENSNFDVHDYPFHIKLKDDITIKEMAKNHILRYLPAKSLAKCQLVSKEWDLWISSPFFAHTQSQYFSQTSGFFQDDDETIRFISLDNSSYGVPYPSLYFLPQKVSIRSSCNGLLLCQASDDENEIYVCNPANKEWIQLPNSGYYHGKEPKNVLAFEPSSLNFEPRYQVICPFSVPGEGPILYFDIYDSNTKSWRTCNEICLDFDESDVKSEGLYVNGIVYWETTRGELLAFDLKNEFYSVQKLPLGGALSKVNGELCYVKGYYCHSVKMCVLDVYGGGVMSLKSTMSVDVRLDGVEDGEMVDCRVLGNSCDDVVAFILEKSQGQNCLFAYHMKDQKVEGPWYVWNSIKLFPYVNSLVSIGS
ncbi:hypothetical protein Lser_V15G07276 [Lactuca serriola]